MNGYVTALYLRLSSADEKNHDNIEYQESDSITNQRDLLTAFVTNQSDLCGTKIIEICDDGFTGTHFNRPGMKQLLELVRNGGVNCIVVKDFSRFGRNYIEAGNYIEQVFPFLGVRFISVNDNYDSSREDISAGNINVAFTNLIHELYAKDISVKVRTAQKQRWEKGENIAACPIFGYVKSKTDRYKLVIDESAAAVVRLIFDMAVGGCDTTQIAHTLNERGIPTPSVFRRDSGYKLDWKRTDIPSATFWDVSMTYRIITDERYTGKAIYGKYRVAAVGSKKNVSVPKEDWVVCENAFEAIISKDTYIQAQKVLHKCSGVSHSQSKPRRKIRCGGCGRSMQRYDCKKPVFVCKTPFYIASPKCVQEQILESDIHEIVFDTIRRQIELFADNDRKRQNEADSSKHTRRNISEQIQELHKSFKTLSHNRLSFYESYKDGKISREDYLRHRETLNSQIADTKKQIQALELESERNILSTPKPIEQAYMQFAEARHICREMIDCLVDSIIIYNGNRIEIKLKTADEFANITI